jgi:flagellar hook assembly protein FlgD
LTQATEARDTGTAPATRLAVAVVAALALAGGGAFFLAAQLKAAKPVIARLDRLVTFSPNGDGRKDVESIGFRLKTDDHVAVDVIDVDGGRVRRVGEDLDTADGRQVRVSWDGRDDDGRRAPDGFYRIRITLRREGRSVVAPQPFRLDTTPPRPAVIVESAPVIAPGRPVDFRIRGAGPKATPRLRIVRTDVEPVQIVRAFDGEPGVKTYQWDGRLDDGTPARPGTYLITVASRDGAGNEGSGVRMPPRRGAIPGRPGVTIRTLAVQPPVRPVQAGRLVSFRVDARGRRYGWSVRRLGGSRPVKRNGRPKRDTHLTFRAPGGVSGVYLLEVRSGRAVTRVPFAVQSSEHAALTVVLPMITWLGRSPLDDASDPDGLPDTLGNGAVVRFPRLFARNGGLPAGFADGVAPLLVFLDRSRIRYDLVTDLALALDEQVPESDGGLLFAGTPEWTSRGLAKRLRRYVEAGGDVALFGPGALRAGVTVGDGKLTHATPPAATDAFGGRLADVRALEGDAPVLSVLEEDPQIGLLEGFSGELTGFDAVEELISPGRGEVAVSVGQAITEEEAARAEEADERPRVERPVLSAVRIGDGLAIRVGLPAWSERLAAGDGPVRQITRNVVDILRGVRPRPRSVG